MDRSWISTTKPGDPKYLAGVRQFVNCAVKNSQLGSKLPCPCYMCHNLMHHRVDKVLKHLNKWAFDRTYTIKYGMVNQRKYLQQVVVLDMMCRKIIWMRVID